VLYHMATFPMTLRDP